VLAEIGQPQASEMKDGKRVDVFSFVQGYSKGAKAGRAVFHGAADVFTLGLWEVVGTPTEFIFTGEKLAYEVTYNTSDKVEKVVKLMPGNDRSTVQTTQEVRQEATQETQAEPEAEPVQKETGKADEQAAKYANLKVDLNCRSDVSLSSSDKERILDLIVKNIPTECPNQFRNVNASEVDQQTLHAVVNITRYDEGNAFARAMLAGLGQMHIDATVTLSDYQTNEEFAKYEVTKTFAWGGVYGAVTGIKDIQDGFAKAVAASIGGKKESGG
jgi:hypothetical protein